MSPGDRLPKSMRDGAEEIIPVNLRELPETYTLTHALSTMITGA
jgi:hypothetical protein